jgi:flagellar hook-associated protein 3 FlgL
VEGRSARIKADGAAATSAAAGVQAAYSAVGAVADLAAQVRSQISAALSGTYSSGAAPITAAQAQTWLTSLQGELNTEIGGQYVFAGAASDRRPVDFASSGYDPTTSPGVADTAYYSGGSTARTLTTSEGLTIQLSVTADQPGFEKLARALSLIASAPTDQTTLQTAYDQVGAAVTEIAQSQAALANQASMLSDVSSAADTKTTTLDNLATTLDGADLTTAAVLVTQYQTQLEAVYQTISKLSSDSLLKYLS